MVCQELVHGGLLPGGDAGQVVVHQEEVTEDVGVEALGAGRQEAIKVVDGVLPQALPHEPLQMLQAEGLTRLQHQPVEGDIVALAREEGEESPVAKPRQAGVLRFVGELGRRRHDGAGFGFGVEV